MRKDKLNIGKFIPALLAGVLVIFALLFSCSLVGSVEDLVGKGAREAGDLITSSSGLKLAWIPAGTFIMGSPTTEPDRQAEETQHSVALTKGFYMGIYQVTQDQYQPVMGINPSYFNNDPASGEVQGKRPVEKVTWYDAVEFCNKLSEMEGFATAYSITGRTPASGYPITNATVTIDWNASGYRLPTEAQWEYACRAGTTTAYNTGNTISDNIGWHYFNSDSDGSGRKTHEIGKKPANAWGLYDMHGNVQEWCWDWHSYDYNDSFQTRTSTTATGNEDPAGSLPGTIRMLRGGSWRNSADILRSAYRAAFLPKEQSDNWGFRVVLPASSY